MARPSVAWLIVLLLLWLLVSHNGDLDLASFAVAAANLQQFSDVSGFIFGHWANGELLSAASIEALKQLQHHCGVGSEDSILELGFGNGKLAQLLLNAGVRRYEGIELSEAMVNLTIRRLGRDALERVRLHHSNAPFDLLHDEAVNFGGSAPRMYSHVFAVFLLDALQAKDAQNLLTVVHQLLRPGGRLCASFLKDDPHLLPVRLYKTAWRTVPLLLGGRRPVTLQRLVDIQHWSILHSWSDVNWLGLPFESVVLQRSSSDDERDLDIQDKLERESLRSAAMQRWAQHANIQQQQQQQQQQQDESSVQGSLEHTRQWVKMSVASLPAGPLEDVVQNFLPLLDSAVIDKALDAHISNMSHEDLLIDLQNDLEAKPAAQVLIDMSEFIKETDTTALERWHAPQTENMSFVELRDHIVLSLDDAMDEAKHDVDIMEEILQRREDAKNAKTLSELQALQEHIDKEVLLPASEMSREALEAGALEIYQSFSKEDLIDELIDAYSGRSTDELQEKLRAQFARMDRVEKEERIIAILDEGTGQGWLADWLRPLAFEVAENLLNEGDLNFMTSRGAASAVRMQRTSGTIYRRRAELTSPQDPARRKDRRQRVNNKPELRAADRSVEAYVQEPRGEL